ncbi:MAG: S9 family peptidase [Phycisphaerales bacterium]
MHAAIPGLAVILLLVLALAACTPVGLTPPPAGDRPASGLDAMSMPLPDPPRADQRPVELTMHGDVRVDEYYWLRERENPEVIAHLEAENAYLKAVMAPTESLQETLYEELVGRMRQDDSTVPVRHGAYWYFTRYEEGQSYPIHARTHRTLDAPEEVLLDVNQMAEGHGFFSVGTRQPSPDHTKLAYAVDDVGRRIYDIEIMTIASRNVTERITDVAGNLVWAEDGRHLFYARRDLETLRTHQIWRHELGTDPSTDVLVFEETDETFSCWVSKTRSKRFLVINSSQTIEDEVRILDARDPLGTWRVVLPRERGHEYSVDHWGDSLIIRTNRGAENFRLVQAPIDDPAAWESLVPHRSDVLLERVDLFSEFMVLTERRDGLRRLRVRRMADGIEHEIDFPDPTYAVGMGQNPEFDTASVRFSYSSLTTPASVYDYDLVGRDRTLMKRDEVFGGFDPANYTSERVWATADDGTRVPVSVVYRAPLERDGGRPLLLYGYGSYGSSVDARFNPNVVSLLDRGFVYAIAHVRGGQELGRAWYESGKLQQKRNTFTDFIDCAEHLVAEGYTAPERLCASGGSAGGLLVGAVANMRPDLFAAVVAAVPFVDVVTTMLDASIPLTTFEWDEWGDPRDPASYAYMLSYSPYDQVRSVAYPEMLVTTGLHDSQVQYWEPAKWVARLRDRNTGDGRLVFKCTMEAGHGGASGRYDRYRDEALRYAFLITAVE